MPQSELAQRMGRPANKLNEIVQGKRQITADTALELELALGLPASFWLNLEKNFQLTKARLTQERALRTESEHLVKFPFKEMCRFGWIKKCGDTVAQTRELLLFFGTTSFEQLKHVKSLAPAWRKSRHKEASEYALVAWLQQGIREAQRIDVGKFSPSGLRAHLRTFRTYTRQQPEEFESELVKLCAANGVAVTFVPHLPKTYVNGAAYWHNDRAVIQLSLRFKWADIFWFNFFHELGHVLLHLKSRKRAFLDEKNDFGGTPISEDVEADTFAGNTLIPEKAYEDLLRLSYRRKEVLVDFAEQIGVAPGIVVGRLQHDGHLHPSQMNGLKTQFDWAGAEATE